MDRLWSPWRSEYIAAGASAEGTERECVFCKIKGEPENDERNFVLHRAQSNFVVLNIHPYTTGHVLIVPYEHVADLDGASKDTTDELMDLIKRSQTALRQTYSPAGYNIGMNLGIAAGAGIVNHIHTHIMPRWVGDTNFMSTVGQTRVLPEDLSTTYQKLHNMF